MASVARGGGREEPTRVRRPGGCTISSRKAAQSGLRAPGGQFFRRAVFSQTLAPNLSQSPKIEDELLSEIRP
jgi:hypothetical protein